LRGPNVTFNQREASSLAALAFAAAAIRDGRAAAMLTGGADHVDEVFFKAHDRFRALAPKRLDGDDTARPFDRRRNGFILGEGGFILLVESAASAAQRGARIYGEILGTGGASEPGGVNDWPAESGAFVRSMRAALTQAAMPPGGVHAIFAAADGSPDLDAIEAQAIGEVFGSRIPVVSIKGAIGEMGAAGAASLAAGLLSFADRRLPPTAGFVEADPGSDVSVCGEARPCEGDVFLVNSAASGGATYSMLVRAAAGHCA
jgi:3-oxoacyl-(acyl-carrier-protein) synthase